MSGLIGMQKLGKRNMYVVSRLGTNEVKFLSREAIKPMLLKNLVVNAVWDNKVVMTYEIWFKSIKDTIAGVLYWCYEIIDKYLLFSFST